MAENGFGRTTIFDYSAENVIAFSTFLKCERTGSIFPLYTTHQKENKLHVYKTPRCPRRRNISIGIPLDLSIPTEMTSIEPLVENEKS